MKLACEKRKFEGPLSVNQQLEPNRSFSCFGIISNVLRVSAALNHDDNIPGWFQEFHDDQRGLIILLLQVRVVMRLEFAVVILAQVLALGVIVIVVTHISEEIFVDVASAIAAHQNASVVVQRIWEPAIDSIKLQDDTRHTFVVAEFLNEEEGGT